MSGIAAVFSARKRRRSTQDTHVRGLPGVVVLLQVLIASGRSPRDALSYVARLGGPAGSLAQVCTDVGGLDRRLRLGADFSSVLVVAERDDLPPATLRVLDALRRGEVDGAPLAMQFEVMLFDLRRQRATALDLAAQRLTVSMLFPLVVCILPAFILLAVVPLVQVALAGLPT